MSLLVLFNGAFSGPPINYSITISENPGGSLLIGNTKILSATFTNLLTGALVNPQTVTLRILQGGAITVYTYNSSATTGKYSAEVPLTASGTLIYRWESGGVFPAAVENKITVLSSAIIPG